MKIEQLSAAAKAVIGQLTQDGADTTDGKAKELIKTLRERREFKLLRDVVTVYDQIAGFDPETQTYQAQGLIEGGDPAEARSLLTDIAGRISAASPAFIEAKGLLGRAWKQTFFESSDKTGDAAREALDSSLDAYQACYDAAGGSSIWAAVNLLALSYFAKREGIQTKVDLQPSTLAQELLSALDATAPEQRDNWYHATRAEAYLGLGDLDAAEAQISDYVRSENTTAFALGSTLRQFTDLWQLDRQGERGYGIVQALRAALLTQKRNGSIEISPDEIRDGAGTQPSDVQLQKILGPGGLVSFDWMQRGILAARSVGVISHVVEGRRATGFLLRGGDLIPSIGDELIVMTNSHVIGDPNCPTAIPCDEAEIAFEAAEKGKIYNFTKVLWYSTSNNLDCSLLRIDRQPTGIAPLTIARAISPIPRLETAQRPRVYVIGYPGGRALSFSFQDNDLLDHEAPPDGTPASPGLRRVQYRAPTEPGSSGSPVFDSSLWRVIALHHAGDKEMHKLNGKTGVWPANEGIWIQSIVQAAAQAQV